MKGAEIGSEVGFYHGCFYVWEQMLQNEGMHEKIKCVSLACLCAMLSLVSATVSCAIGNWLISVCVCVCPTAVIVRVDLLSPSARCSKRLS